MQNSAERRQSGRRSTRRHAWIAVPGRPRLSCLVINISTTGACLELRAPPWLPADFHLYIDGEAGAHLCEVRHVGAHGIGVNFRPSDELAQPAPGPGHANHASLDWLANRATSGKPDDDGKSTAGAATAADADP